MPRKLIGLELAAKTLAVDLISISNLSFTSRAVNVEVSTSMPMKVPFILNLLSRFMEFRADPSASDKCYFLIRFHGLYWLIRLL